MARLFVAVIACLASVVAGAGVGIYWPGRGWLQSVDDVQTEQLPGVGVGNHLGEAFGVSFDDRFGVRPHREFARLDLIAALDRFLLGQADAADLRLAVGA